MSIFLKKAAEMADGILDLAAWFGNRVESKKSLAKPEDLVGLEGEVVTTIGKGAIGEVMVAFGDARQNFSARANDLNLELMKGETIHVVRSGASVLYVAKGRKPIPVHVEKPVHNHGAGGSCCNHEH